MNPDQWVVIQFTAQGVVVYGPYDSEAKARDVRANRWPSHLTAVVKCCDAYEDIEGE